MFEGRGGEELAAEIGNILTRTYDCPSCFDLEALCIIPEEQCWILYVDVLVSLIRHKYIHVYLWFYPSNLSCIFVYCICVDYEVHVLNKLCICFQLLECGGNLFDVASIAVKAALYNTKYLYFIYFIVSNAVKYISLYQMQLNIFHCIKCSLTYCSLHYNIAMFSWQCKECHFFFFFYFQRIPKVTVSRDEGLVELEISDDPYDVQRVEVQSAPCIVTVCKVLIL